jgi:murein DD-endopeptidase MepM/ murein hydrolase activator NlpD
MSKTVTAVIFIFFVLVAANLFVSFMGSLMPVHGSGIFALPTVGSAVGATSGFGGNGVFPIDANLFNKDGVGSMYVTQGYGRTAYAYLYPGGWHDGVDLAASYGTPIYSPNNGTVIATGDQDNYCYHRGFGKYVAIKDPATNLVLWYAHLGQIDVAVGQSVAKSSIIGLVGATGLETGTHLHFSIFQGSGFTMQSRDGCGPEPTGQDLDPLSYLGSVYK